jgi:prophage tail gpP-like protein
MKIEFIKKSDLDGVFYYTEIDGKLVIGSTKMDKVKAYDIFLRLVENEGKTFNIETLETKEL